MCSACATSRACASNSAHEWSSRSLMLGEYAASRTAIPISSLAYTSADATSSAVIGSSAEIIERAPGRGCRSRRRARSSAGATYVVASYCSTTAGPSNASPGRSSARSYTGVSTNAVPSNTSRRSRSARGSGARRAGAAAAIRRGLGVVPMPITRAVTISTGSWRAA